MSPLVALAGAALVAALVVVMERIIEAQARKIRTLRQECWTLSDECDRLMHESDGLALLVRQRDARIDDLMEAGIEQTQRLNLQSEALRDLLADSK